MHTYETSQSLEESLADSQSDNEEVEEIVTENQPQTTVTRDIQEEEVKEKRKLTFKEAAKKVARNVKDSSTVRHSRNEFADAAMQYLRAMKGEIPLPQDQVRSRSPTNQPKEKILIV